MSNRSQGRPVYGSMLLQDIRYAVRTLTRDRGFTFVAVACLALGIGVNAAIFSFFDGIVLQPYPYPHAERIVVFRGVNPRLHISQRRVPFLEYRDIRMRRRGSKPWRHSITAA